MTQLGRPIVFIVSYRVFARKYRPQTFKEVIGQDHITRTLQNAVSLKRLAQAYLFVGPRGIGKTSTARILAKALNCKNGPTAEPCGACDACIEIAEGRSLDVIEIDGASNNGVENIRDLRESAAYAPSSGPFKVYLIDEVHMLSTGAFNALLKTLEEPPPHVKFIFATTEAQKVPATITSRCQRFDLRRIPASLIKEHLLYIAKNEKIVLEEAAADAIARGAEGGLRDAESMLDQMVAFCGEKIVISDVMEVFGFTPREVVERLAESLFIGDAATALEAVSVQSDAGKDLSRLTAELVSHLRDQLVASAINGGGAVSQDKFLDLIDHFSAAESSMKWVADKKLQLDVAVIKALHILDETSLTDVIQSLTDLRGGKPLVASNPEVVPKVQPAVATTHLPPVVAVTHEKTSVPPSLPHQAAPTSPANSSASIDASLVWERISADLAKNSFIRFSWLKDGVYDRVEKGRLIVRFPVSSKESALVFMEEAVRRIEAQILKEMDMPLRAVFEFDETLQPIMPEVSAEEPIQEESPEPMEAAKVRSLKPPPEPINPMEEFLNDPLIEKALEKFQGTLQTPRP